MTQAKHFFTARTTRLALTYLAIIMSLTLVFSGVIYSISVARFDRHAPPDVQTQTQTQTQVNQLFEERAELARADVLTSLVMLNIATFGLGTVLSYLLARRTLAPIEASMEAQSQFVSDASHELRTPLTALQVTNEVALRKKKLTLDDAKDLIHHNVEETIKLRELSESLLGLVKQENADTSRTNVLLQTVVDDVIQTVVPLADAKKMTIETAIADEHVETNRAALTQVVRILVDNAIKYSPNESTVTIATRKDGSHTCVDIIDHGPGIAPDDQTKIFTRFYRVDESRSRQHVEGSGLGLAIAHTICARQGMQLHVTSQLGAGATFTVTV